MWRPKPAADDGDFVLDIDVETQDQRTNVTVSGVLSEPTAGALRDQLLKCSAHGPDLLVVDIDDLRVANIHLLSVFSVVARRLEEWPGTALVLVCRQPALRGVLTGNASNRSITVVDDPANADDAVAVPRRRQAWRRLPWATHAPRAARRFVKETCAQWGAKSFADSGTTIVSELVENTLLHTMSGPRVRLQLRDGVFTVAVTDDSPAPPVLREQPRELGLGLHIVAELADTWGSTPTRSGGKVVWAVLAEEGLPSSN